VAAASLGEKDFLDDEFGSDRFASSSAPIRTREVTRRANKP
jgi:hypothetical protein